MTMLCRARPLADEDWPCPCRRHLQDAWAECKLIPVPNPARKSLRHTCPTSTHLLPHTSSSSASLFDVRALSFFRSPFPHHDHDIRTLRHQYPPHAATSFHHDHGYWPACNATFSSLNPRSEDPRAKKEDLPWPVGRCRCLANPSSNVVAPDGHLLAPTLRTKPIS